MPIGNYEEKNKKPLAARKLRINTPFLQSITVSATAIPNFAAVRFAKHVVPGPTGVTAAHSVSPTAFHSRRKQNGFDGNGSIQRCHAPRNWRRRPGSGQTDRL